MKILRALARVADVKDFRVKSLMSQLGLDATQTTSFYRQLIPEARQVVARVAELEDRQQRNQETNRRLLERVDQLKARGQYPETAGGSCRGQRPGGHRFAEEGGRT